MTEPLIPRGRAEPAPGVVHVPGWLEPEARARLVRACREWARPPAGLAVTRLPGGGVMSVRSVSLGWQWVPYRYVRTAPDGAPVKPFPGWLGDLGRRAVTEAYGPAAAHDYAPDVALVNFYAPGAHMALHQDKDELTDAPVVSLSLGEACLFRLGNTEIRGRPWQDLRLDSGDLLVFGGPSRFVYHGVPKTLAGTADPAAGLREGRLNITIRVTGLGGGRDGGG
ncbi:MAG: alpha-ketoglutarate-dependent dioxygenase AlkB [Streptosporangiales bacterium]|nr:alpha-ketoglutarate-dependent dioxygenase AlkB [Streptosporangiales bacterium]